MCWSFLSWLIQVYASIGEHTNDVSKASEFAVNVYSGAYAENITLLTAVKERGPREYHALMHDLYKKT